MLEENTPDKAFAALNNAADGCGSQGQAAWDDAMIATLIALGKPDEAQTHHWTCFERDLSAPHLRAYLKALPDFEDVEAEDRAKSYALSYPTILSALRFCLEWPDLLTASQLVIKRADEIDGEDYEFINYAADVLRDKYPLVAALLLRSMIDFAINHGRTARYKYVISHLQDCEKMDADIRDYGMFQSHESYVAMLRNHADPMILTESDL
jgi:hypothetical protein